MSEKESPLGKFRNHVEEYVWVQLQCYEEEILKLSKVGNVDDVAALLAETNNLIDFYCGDDNEIYDQLRYRMFLDAATGSIVIIQGEEIDVDFRGWMEDGADPESEESEDDEE